MTSGGPHSPQQMGELGTVLFQSAASPFAVQVVLIPQAGLLGRSRMGCVPDVLDVVAVDGDQPGHQVRPRRSDQAGGVSTPVEAGDDRLVQSECVDQISEIVGQRRLARPHGCVVDEACRPVATQIWHDKRLNFRKPIEEIRPLLLR